MQAIDAPVSITRICLNRTDSMVTIRYVPPTSICGSFHKHYIYGRDDALALYSLRDSVEDNTLTEKSFKLPNARQWQFFFISKFACNGIDSFISDTVLVDLEQPEDWELDSVSVDLITQRTIMGWSPHPAIDKKGYFLYHVGANNQLIMDSTALFFSDLTVGNPANSAQSYSLATYDSCQNTSPISPGHTNIYLSGTYDTCAREITLNWTRYSPAQDETYYINLSELETADFQIIDSTDFDNRIFTLSNLLPGRQYCFFVRIRNSSPLFTSSSNRVCFTTPTAISAENYIQSVSVNPNEQIDIFYQTALDEGVVQLLKWEGGDNFTLLQQTNLPDVNSQSLVFTYPSVNTFTDIYDYRLAHIDKCGNPIPTDTSDFFNSILLEVEEVNNGAELNWNEYVNFDAGVGQYQILKYLGDNPTPRSTWNILSSENSSIFDFFNLYDISDLTGTVCFVIRAIEASVNQYGRQDTAYSNTVCFLRELSVYFPTAFAPDGMNTRFFAKGVGIDEDNSNLEIYNRWGELIFQTNQVQTGWDGKDQRGEDCAQGAYIYVAKITGDLGDKKEYRGVITLIR